jgi:hypothetical protein
MTPTGRSCVGRKLSSSAKDAQKEGAVFKSIPWDVWAAATLAVAAFLAMIFEPAPAVLIVVYIFLCAYIVVKTIKGAQS